MKGDAFDGGIKSCITMIELSFWLFFHSESVGVNKDNLALLSRSLGANTNNKLLGQMVQDWAYNCNITFSVYL